MIYLSSYLIQETIRGRHGDISSLQDSRAYQKLPRSCQAFLRGCKSRLFDYLPFLNSSENLVKKGFLGSTQNSSRILEGRSSLLEGYLPHAHFREGKTLTDIAVHLFFSFFNSPLSLFTFQEEISHG